MIVSVRVTLDKVTGVAAAVTTTVSRSASCPCTGTGTSSTRRMKAGLRGNTDRFYGMRRRRDTATTLVKGDAR
jgi:hypothetical protein